jgi:alkylation response protein AidB-like acyl-CoA dehydrogenase
MKGVQRVGRLFARRFISPLALFIDQRCQLEPSYVDWQLLRRSLSYHLLGFCVPEALGGQGHLALPASILFEELAASCPGVACIFAFHTLGVVGLLLSLDIRVYDRYVSEIAVRERHGEPYIMSVAVDEMPVFRTIKGTRSTSDLTIQKVPGGFILNGKKTFVFNGPIAKYHLLFDVLEAERPLKTLSAFIVPADAPGLLVGKVMHKMGLSACLVSELIFKDVFVPEEDRIAYNEDAFQLLAAIRIVGNIMIGALSAGAARGALERISRVLLKGHPDSIRRLNEETIQMNMGEILRKIHMARQGFLDGAMYFDFYGVARILKNKPTHLTLDLLPRAVRGSAPLKWFFHSNMLKRAMKGYSDLFFTEEGLYRSATYAAIAKITGSECANEVCHRALDIINNGANEERLEIEKLFRDVRLLSLVPEVNERTIQRVFRTIYYRGRFTR